MNEVAELLAELTQRGVKLEPRGDALAFHPRSKVTGELRARLQQHKPEILRLLHGEVADPVADIVVPAPSIPPVEYSVVVLQPKTDTFESALLSLFAPTTPPKEVLVCGPVSKQIRKTIRCYARRHVRLAASPIEAPCELVVLLDGRTLLGRDWIASASAALTVGVGAVYSDHELLTTGGRTNYPDLVTGDDLARSGFESPTVLVRRPALVDVWLPDDSVSGLLKRLARHGWQLRKHPVPVLFRGGEDSPYFDRQELARETVTLFIPLAQRRVRPLGP